MKILDANKETGKIIASVRQGAVNFQSALDISGVAEGDLVNGTVSALHKDHAMLSLMPSKVRAILAYANIAKHKNLPIAQVKASLTVGDTMNGLAVVSRNAEKGFVLVAHEQKDDKRSRRVSLSSNNGLTIDAIQVGQTLPGLVVSHGRKGAVVRISSKISGSIHAVDVSDDYGPKVVLPSVSTTLNCVVIAIDKERKQLTLSTRPSRLSASTAASIVDQEVDSLSDLKLGQKIRGFIKSIADHGLFINIGRNLDARVQIKELFDDVRSLVCTLP